MVIPLLIGLIPPLIGLAEKMFSSDPKSGDKKKSFVTDVLGNLYDKYLANKIPDLKGIDERQFFLDACSFLIDKACERLTK